MTPRQREALLAATLSAATGIASLVWGTLDRGPDNLRAGLYGLTCCTLGSGLFLLAYLDVGKHDTT